MSDLDRIIAAILEANDEGDIKDILGPDYGEPPGPGSKEGYVDRHDRWADVQIGEDHWCISYLTPVAVFIHGEGAFITDKYWSQATSKHITKWANEVGWGSGMRYAEIQQRAKVMPQQELLDRFKEEAAKVKWSKRQAKMAHRLPEIPYGLKSSRSDQIDIEPYREPE